MCVNVNVHAASKIMWRMLIKINGEMELNFWLADNLKFKKKHYD